MALKTKRHSTPFGSSVQTESTGIQARKLVFTGGGMTTRAMQLFVGVLAFLVISLRAGAESGMPLWTNRYSSGPGAFDDRAYGVAVGINGQVFVTGTAWGNASYDYLTVGYSSSGAPVWTNRYNGPANSNDVANAIVIDRDGSVLVTGRCVGEGGTMTMPRLSIRRAEPELWVNRYSGTGSSDDAAVAVAIGLSNSVIVTGGSVGLEMSSDFTTIAYSSEAPFSG